MQSMEASHKPGALNGSDDEDLVCDKPCFDGS